MSAVLREVTNCHGVRSSGSGFDSDARPKCYDTYQKRIGFCAQIRAKIFVDKSGCSNNEIYLPNFFMTPYTIHVDIQAEKNFPVKRLRAKNIQNRAKANRLLCTFTQPMTSCAKSSLKLYSSKSIAIAGETTRNKGESTGQRNYFFIYFYILLSIFIFHLPESEFYRCLLDGMSALGLLDRMLRFPRCLGHLSSR